MDNMFIAIPVKQITGQQLKTQNRGLRQIQLAMTNLMKPRNLTMKFQSNIWNAI